MPENNGQLRPIEPLILRTIDGQERKFLLSMGGIKRLKIRFGVQTISEFLQQDAEACGVPILYEALLDKGGLTEDQFAELLPSHLEATGEAIGKLLGVSFPKPDPTTASEMPTATLQ